MKKADAVIYGPFISRAQARKLGLIHYFSGNSCKRGHVCVRFTSSANCFDCAYERNVSVREGTPTPGQIDRENAGPIVSYGPFITCQQARDKGLNHYYVGPCSHGHYSAKRVKNNECLECARQKQIQKRAQKGIKTRAQMKDEKLNAAGIEQVFGPFLTFKQAVSKGISLYYEGNPCERGHVTTRYTSGRECTDCISVKQAIRRRDDPGWRLIKNLQTRLYHCLRGESRYASIQDLVGCTKAELVAHLEAQFKEGMTWDNYGVGGWHVDHIRPCDSFQDPEDPKLWSFQNLQPLWGDENIRKSNKF